MHNRKVLVVNDGAYKFAKELCEGTGIDVVKTEKIPEGLFMKSRQNKIVAHFPSYQVGTFKKAYVEPGRNAPCPCKSGKKFKHCCLLKLTEPLRAKVLEAHKKTEGINGDHEGAPTNTPQG